MRNYLSVAVMISAILAQSARADENRDGGVPLITRAAVAAGAGQQLPDVSLPSLIYGAPGSLTWGGITAYGLIDVNAFYQSHGSAPSPYMNGQYLVAKNSGPTQFGFTNNALGQSLFGLRVEEPLYGLAPVEGLRGWSFVSNMSTVIQPVFGELQNTCKSLVKANGTNEAVGTISNFDSARCGQFFNGELWAGIKNPVWGELRYGRQLTMLFDEMLLLYDPQRVSYATSLLGTAGTYGGGFGDTEDKIWNSSLEYRKGLGPAHLGVQYRFPGDQQGGRAYAVDLGADIPGWFHGLSVDGIWGQYKDGISASPLTSSAAKAPGSCQYFGVSLANCSSLNILNAVVSDNTAWSLMAAYNFASIGLPTMTAMGGYENIRYTNPSQKLPNGYQTIGGYSLTFTSTSFSTYTSNKVLDIGWIGARWAVTPRMTAAVAYYLLEQNAYIRAGVGCTKPGIGTSTATQCPGDIGWYSFTLDYAVTPRIDVYAGLSHSAVSNGLSAGYTFNSNYNVVSGLRYRL